MVDSHHEEAFIKVQQVASQTETNFGSDKNDKVASNDPVNEQVMELENEGLNNLMNQQSKENNNEDLGQLENETETNVAMEQDSNQVKDNSKQSQAPNKIVFQDEVFLKERHIWSIKHPIRVNGKRFKLYQELEKLWENIGIISISVTLLTIQ